MKKIIVKVKDFFKSRNKSKSRKEIMDEVLLEVQRFQVELTTNGYVSDFILATSNDPRYIHISVYIENTKPVFMCIITQDLGVDVLMDKSDLYQCIKPMVSRLHHLSKN